VDLRVATEVLNMGDPRRKAGEDPVAQVTGLPGATEVVPDMVLLGEVTAVPADLADGKARGRDTTTTTTTRRGGSGERHTAGAPWRRRHSALLV
jgi:hypothetical protein